MSGKLILEEPRGHYLISRAIPLIGIILGFFMFIYPISFSQVHAAWYPLFIGGFAIGSILLIYRFFTQQPIRLFEDGIVPPTFPLTNRSEWKGKKICFPEIKSIELKSNKRMKITTNEKKVYYISQNVFSPTFFKELVGYLNHMGLTSTRQ